MGFEGKQIGAERKKKKKKMKEKEIEKGKDVIDKCFLREGNARPVRLENGDRWKRIEGNKGVSHMGGGQCPYNYMKGMNLYDKRGKVKTD